MNSAEGSSPCFIVKDLETGELFTWGMEEVLFEINRDHSEEFIPYDEKDWQEGWDEWCDCFELTEIKEEATDE